MTPLLCLINNDYYNIFIFPHSPSLKNIKGPFKRTKISTRNKILTSFSYKY